MGKDILHRVGNGGHCGCETVSREVLPQVEIHEKWTQEPPCFAITIWCAIKIAHQSLTTPTTPRVETIYIYIIYIRRYSSDDLSRNNWCHALSYSNRPLDRYVKLWVAHVPRMPGAFPPHIGFKGNRQLVTPACIMARGEENVPGIPGACAIRNLTYLVKDQWVGTDSAYTCYFRG